MEVGTEVGSAALTFQEHSRVVLLFSINAGYRSARLIFPSEDVVGVIYCSLI